MHDDQGLLPKRSRPARQKSGAGHRQGRARRIQAEQGGFGRNRPDRGSSDRSGQLGQIGPARGGSERIGADRGPWGPFFIFLAREGLVCHCPQGQSCLSIATDRFRDRRRAPWGVSSLPRHCCQEKIVQDRKPFRRIPVSCSLSPLSGTRGGADGNLCP